MRAAISCCRSEPASLDQLKEVIRALLNSNSARKGRALTTLSKQDSVASLWIFYTRCDHTFFSLVSSAKPNFVLHFFFSVHLSSHCPITSDPGLVNESQMDSQVACLLDRVLATCYPVRLQILAAKEHESKKTNLIPVPLGLLRKYWGHVCTFWHNLASLVYITDKKHKADCSDLYRLWFALGSFCYATLSEHELLLTIRCQHPSLCTHKIIWRNYQTKDNMFTRMFFGPFPVASSDYILRFKKLDPCRLGNGPIRFASNYILPWLKQNSAVVRGFNQLQLRSAWWKPDTAGHFSPLFWHNALMHVEVKRCILCISIHLCSSHSWTLCNWQWDNTHWSWRCSKSKVCWIQPEETASWKSNLTFIFVKLGNNSHGNSTL